MNQPWIYICSPLRNFKNAPRSHLCFLAAFGFGEVMDYLSFNLCSVAQLYLTLRPHGPEPIRLLCLCDFPGKNTRVGCHFLLQGISPTQEIEPALAGGFLTTSATWDAHLRLLIYKIQLVALSRNIAKAEIIDYVDR